MLTADPVRFLDELNRSYERLHTAKEDAFWRARMDLDPDGEAAQRRLDELEIAWSSFLQDPAQLAAVRSALAIARTNGADEPTLTGLRGWERTFASHCIESAAGRSLAAEIVVDEGRLERARGALRLGYVDRSGELREASSVKLAMMLRSEPDEALRRAAWDGLRSIEPHVIGAGFLDLVRKRNRLARELGA